MKHNYYLFLFIPVLILYNCSAEKVNEVANELDLYNLKHFDGVQIGDSLKNILTSNKDSIKILEEELILFFSINGEKVNKREVNLNFDEGQVFEITVDVYLQHDSLVEGYFIECKNKLEEIYGYSKVDNGYAAWQTPSINNKVIEIELFDESIDHDIPMVSVNFYEDHQKSFYAE